MTQQPPKPVERKTYEDGYADASPKQSQFFTAMRSEAFDNVSPVQQFVEFWSIVQVDQARDKWNLMHYMLHNLDRDDGSFQIDVAKTNISFADALAALAEEEYVAGHHAMKTTRLFDMSSRYPADDYPVVKEYFYDLPHYKKPAYLEGFQFDENNRLYRRVQGLIVSDGVFSNEEMEAAIEARQEGMASMQTMRMFEKGVVRDMFNDTVGKRLATLDGLLKATQALALMDKIVTAFGAFYLATQDAIGLDGNFNRIEGLSPKEREDNSKAARNLVKDVFYSKKPTTGALPDLLENLSIGDMLEEAKEIGVYTEPYEKFVAECTLYAHLLHAAHVLAKLEKGIISANNTDVDQINGVRQAVSQAQETFFRLGGTASEFDHLQSWVTSYSSVIAENNDPQAKEKMVVQSLPNFLSRYYKVRPRIVAKLQQSRTNDAVRDVNLAPAEVKEPVIQKTPGPGK